MATDTSKINEVETEVQKVRADHKKDREQNKIKRDRELDRARTRDTARKNLTTKPKV